MQKLMLVSDEQSLAAVNEVLAGDEYEVGQIVAGQNGGYIVLLDDDLLMGAGDGDIEFEFDDDEE